MARRKNSKKNDFDGLFTSSLLPLAAIAAAGLWWFFLRKPKPLMTSTIDSGGNMTAKAINPSATIDLNNLNAKLPGANSSTVDQILQEIDAVAANFALNQKGSSGAPGLPPKTLIQ